jgi:hypothetical protein
MTARLTIDILAERVCQAVRDVSGGRPGSVGIDRLGDRIGVDDLCLVDAAVAFASAKRWLSISGRPAQTVSLTTAAP